MKDNFDTALGYLLQHEGGFVVNPKDPGGMTNMGVTKLIWEQYVGHPVDAVAMRSLKEADVAPLYRTCYWDLIRGSDLPGGLDYAIFDAAVNQGVPKAVRILQSILDVKTDGVLGSRTLASLDGKSIPALINQYCDERLRFMQSLPTWATFGDGWGNRVSEVRAQAMTLA